MRRVIGRVVAFSLVTEAVVAVVLTVRFAPGYDHSLPSAAYSGVFHAVSAFNNAGFSLDFDSLVRYVSDPWISLTLCAAVILGGLGFPVVFELARSWRRPKTWSVLTRITVVVTVALLVVGTVGMLRRRGRSIPTRWAPSSAGAKVLAAFTAAVIPRTAGFNNLDIAAYQPETLLLTDALMFIGGGSAGTAGGIKVTTFGLLAYVLWAEMRGDPDVEVGRRRVPATNQRQALAIALLGIGLVAVATFLMEALTDFGFDQVAFEVISAFATVGLSTGVPPTCRRPHWSSSCCSCSSAASGRSPWHPGWRCGSVPAATSSPRKGPSLASHEEPVAVIGLGRFGTALALELARGGTEVLAVDARPDIVQRLSGQLGHVVTADSTDPDALTEIGIADFNRVVVAIGNDLEASILTTALLTELEIRDIWAKAVSRQQATILERIGAHHVVFPEQDMGSGIAHLVAGGLLDWVELDPQSVSGRDPAAAGDRRRPARGDRAAQEAPRHRRLGEAGEPDELHPVPADRIVLTYGSVIVIAGRPDDVERFGRTPSSAVLRPGRRWRSPDDDAEEDDHDPSRPSSNAPRVEAVPGCPTGTRPRRRRPRPRSSGLGRAPAPAGRPGRSPRCPPRSAGEVAVGVAAASRQGEQCGHCKHAQRAGCVPRLGGDGVEMRERGEPADRAWPAEGVGEHQQQVPADRRGDADGEHRRRCETERGQGRTEAQQSDRQHRERRRPAPDRGPGGVHPGRPAQAASAAAAARTTAATAIAVASVAAQRARPTGREYSRVSRPAVSSAAVAATRLAANAPSATASRL